MKTDIALKQDVMDELDWESSLDATKIGVLVDDGIVTLNGHVKSYSEKLKAEKAAKRVFGVRAVVEEIKVKLPGSDKRSDEAIARAALDSLKWHANVPEDKIQLKVENGWVTMEGKVNWQFQKEAARKAVKDLTGVIGVTSLIRVEAVTTPTNIKDRIKNAFERSADIDASRVNVRVDGHKVFLSGEVQSYAESRQAETAAWSAPGISSVQNDLKIKFRELAL
jgi:osmotically-inducible protein OsmY